jgi:integrase
VDVFPDPHATTRATVLIHHPSQGSAPSDWRDEYGKPRKANRAAYLAEKWGLVPRDQLLGSRHAGWKGGTHDAAYYKQAHWFVPEYGELFLRLWHRYLEDVVRVDRDHPYAFVNLSGGTTGQMYRLAQYNKAHAAACERIGLQVAKALGTTPHGHRHAYARRLRKAGIEPEHRRRFMHHSAIESQDPYMTFSMPEAQAAMSEAARLLEASVGPLLMTRDYGIEHDLDATELEKIE